MVVAGWNSIIAFEYILRTVLFKNLFGTFQLHLNIEYGFFCIPSGDYNMRI